MSNKLENGNKYFHNQIEQGRLRLKKYNMISMKNDFVKLKTWKKFTTNSCNAMLMVIMRVLFFQWLQIHIVALNRCILCILRFKQG